MALLEYFAAKQVQAAPSPGGSWLRDIGVVAILMVIVAVMILPLPVFVIDSLIAINFACGFTLVLFALFVRDPTELSVFPSLLLLSTLYRLAISIATTRIILIQGHGGDIIEAFGMMVVGGNVVIGLVVFTIITIVQFLVIAKGAERVSEVAARFSLDAMPGKQMSIDSDLRSGLLEKDDARLKRKKLEMESKMHGALDGAMKYVKGDAMASIIIVLVNLVAGFAIGALQRGMPASEAMQTYSILSIGDGLVAQVPALLGAMAAGLLVTRGTDEEFDRHMGDAISRQLGANPRVFVVAGGVTMLMAATPGFPSVVFLVLGATMAVIAAFFEPTLRTVLRRNMAIVRETGGGKLPPREDVQSTDPLAIQPTLPIYLEIDGAPARMTPELITARLHDVINAIEVDLGLPLPQISLRLNCTGSAPQWRLFIWESARAEGPLAGANPLDDLAATVHGLLRRHIGDFVGVQETSDLLTRAGDSYPELVKELMRTLPLTRIAEIFRLLLTEEVPLRPIRDVLEVLVEQAPMEKHPPTLVDLVRHALQRRLMQRIAPGGVVRALMLAPELEERLAVQARENGEIDLAPDQYDQLIHDIQEKRQDTQAIAIVCAGTLRWALRQFLARSLLDLPVVAHGELHASVSLDLAGVVGAMLVPEMDQTA